jgi:hypothetical protein
MIQCINCGGVELKNIRAKVSDQFTQREPNGTNKWSEPDYVPVPELPNLTLVDEDYLDFTFCNHCGQIQGSWQHVPMKY